MSTVSARMDLDILLPFHCSEREVSAVTLKEDCRAQGSRSPLPCTLGDLDSPVGSLGGWRAVPARDFAKAVGQDHQDWEAEPGRLKDCPQPPCVILFCLHHWPPGCLSEGLCIGSWWRLGAWPQGREQSPGLVPASSWSRGPSRATLEGHLGAEPRNQGPQLLDEQSP